MIDPTLSIQAGPTADKTQSGAVLHWRRNDRMGGMVPVWEKNAGAQTPGEKPAAALSYAAQGNDAQDKGKDEPFGFGDLLDMVNPLQHLPIIGPLYREITGDEIRPISKIIGGGVFGGIAGAAGGLVDTVVEYETGRSLAGNVVAAVTSGKMPDYRSDSDKPERQIGEAVLAMQDTAPDLPGSVLAFADLSHTGDPYERMPAADGRTAGTMWHRTPPGKLAAALPPREPISTLSLSPMPARERGYND